VTETDTPRTYTVLYTCSCIHTQCPKPGVSMFFGLSIIIPLCDSQIFVFANNFL